MQLFAGRCTSLASSQHEQQGCQRLQKQPVNDACRYETIESFPLISNSTLRSSSATACRKRIEEHKPADRQLTFAAERT